MIHTVGVGNGESRNPDSRNSRIGSTTGMMQVNRSATVLLPNGYGRWD